MGVDGCGWVLWDLGGTGNTKARQSGYIYGHEGQNLGTMAEEISPDMMFWAGSKKLSNMGADGHSSVRMASVGLVGMGGT